MTELSTEDEGRYLADLEGIDPEAPGAIVRTGPALARLRAAVGARNLAAGHLEVAVGAAREAGCSWSEVGLVLGVSAQAARQKFLRQQARSA